MSNTKTLLDKYKVGDIVQVTISKPNIGNFPIGIIENGHVVCLFERTKKFFVIGSIWEAEVTEVKPKNLVIKHVKCIKTKEECEGEFQEKLNEFKKLGTEKGYKIIDKRN